MIITDGLNGINPKHYCYIRGSFVAISWDQLSMSSSVILSRHAFTFRLSLSLRGGLQGRGGGDYTQVIIGSTLLEIFTITTGSSN